MPFKEKKFRDPIYGYISIPDQYCRDFIDTAIFQRLRRIEQTSMRVLYPTAHHDRFAHSLGVFHLGRIAFAHLKKNSEQYLDKLLNDDQWVGYNNTFILACLMHDCGHSPFSHTFEHYYLFKKEEEIKERICKFFIDETAFSNDYNEASAAPHEKISALVLLEQYSEKITNNGADPKLAARMIMGCKHSVTVTPVDKFENKLISLLNGAGIDVDSLDYIQRDTWSSGVSNVNIDYHRLLSSIMIRPDDSQIFRLVFKKHVLSVIENISIGRNFLYKWIYSHHKVNYEQYLIKNIVESINQQHGNEFCSKIFSIDSFTEIQNFNGTNYFLPTDDDLVYTIKQYYKSDTKIEEYFSRNHKLKALWKTYFEFNDVYFQDVDPKNRMIIFTKIREGALSGLFDPSELLCIPVSPKLKGINPNDFFIDIDGNLKDASKATRIQNENLNYSIVYVSERLASDKSNIINEILQLQV